VDVTAAPDERAVAYDEVVMSWYPDAGIRADAQASCAMVTNKPGAPGRPRISR